MSSLFRSALAVVLLLLPLLAQQSRIVSQGVYSNDQAKRGQAIYTEKCVSCHGPMLEGRLGPPLTGSDFIGVWEKEPLSQLAAKIQKTMPQADPGKLTGQQ